MLKAHSPLLAPELLVLPWAGLAPDPDNMPDAVGNIAPCGASAGAARNGSGPAPATERGSQTAENNPTGAAPLRVLVVDDEPLYGELIAELLSGASYVVRTATSGRGAVDIGTRFHPQILVTDWMLKDDVHGLHVVEALSAVLPEMRSILITGFPSLDVELCADDLGVGAYITKPFSAADIVRSIREVADQQEPQRRPRELAMLELNADESIRFANPAAHRLIDQLGGDPQGQWSHVFAPAGSGELEAAARHWQVLPIARQNCTWFMRTQPRQVDGSRLVVLSVGYVSQFPGDLVEMLLGTRTLSYGRWPFEQRVLVVDSNAAARRACVALLERIGAGAYGAANPAAACELLQKDAGLGYVVVDSGIAGSELHGFLGQIRAARPDVVIIGQADSDRRDDFEQLRVRHFLRKPWAARELVNALTGRISECVSCGLPTPLRHKKEGEAGQTWECKGCGALYLAVLDESAPPDTRANVRPV